MAMTQNQLALVRAIAENRLSDAKKYALTCCMEDTSQKNASYVKRYKEILSNGPSTLELPFNITGMAQMEDVSNFRVDRYYLSNREKKLMATIEDMNKVSFQLMEMGIPYLNATLLTGKSGTGKTTFGRYVAHMLNLPFLYIRFSYLIDSYVGKTAANLRNVLGFARMNRCVIMLDEIDCIANKRTGSTEGATREFNNTTITLLQELDQIKNDSIIIGATNIIETIDPAVKRRFSVHHEVLPLTKEECKDMLFQYLLDVGMAPEMEEIEAAADYLYENGKTPVQAEILNFLVERVADALLKGKATVSFKA